MNQVWLAQHHDYEGGSVYGVYETRELAMEWLKSKRPHEVEIAAAQTEFEKERGRDTWVWEVSEIEEYDDWAEFQTELGSYQIREWPVLDFFPAPTDPPAEERGK